MRYFSEICSQTSIVELFPGGALSIYFTASRSRQFVPVGRISVDSLLFVHCQIQARLNPKKRFSGGTVDTRVVHGVEAFFYPVYDETEMDEYFAQRGSEAEA